MLFEGYASFDYEDSGYLKSELVRLDVLLNGKEIQELSTIRYLEMAEITCIFPAKRKAEWVSILMICISAIRVKSESEPRPWCSS